MRKRCVLCGKKFDPETGKCTGNKCSFIEASQELQNEFNGSSKTPSYNKEENTIEETTL